MFFGAEDGEGDLGPRALQTAAALHGLAQCGDEAICPWIDAMVQRLHDPCAYAEFLGGLIWLDLWTSDLLGSLWIFHAHESLNSLQTGQQQPRVCWEDRKMDE